MKKVTITIDGEKITVPEGQNLLWAALDNGIYIPNLCAIRDKTEPSASCRLCWVEVGGNQRPVTACTERVEEGMVVNTQAPEALRLARTAFELLMASHPVDCGHCLANRNCELQNLARYLRVKLKPKRLRPLLHDWPVDNSNPLFTFDPNKCVLCGRCVWVCKERLGIGVLGFAHRGFDRVVTTFGDEPIGELKCRECQECISVCPTGALVLREGKKTLTAP